MAVLLPIRAMYQLIRDNNEYCVAYMAHECMGGPLGPPKIMCGLKVTYKSVLPNLQKSLFSSCKLLTHSDCLRSVSHSSKGKLYSGSQSIL